MTVIVCVDDKMGMCFNHRRQSSDRLLRADLLSEASGHPLHMNSYSAAQFNETAENFRISEEFLSLAETDDICFVETSPLLPYKDKIQKIILYKWNRRYPGDLFFDLPLKEWTLLETRDFTGSSHKTITKEVYVK